MEIKFLPDNMKTRISSGTKITSFLQCLTELVFNSLDSKASAIAVRLNTLSFQLQVVDNGEGITPENIRLVGQRYTTSKCNSLSDLTKRCKYYGYRGESLASIQELSRVLTITSRADGQDHTFCKIFIINNKSAQVYETRRQRPSRGTTVNVEGFLHNHPVRQKRVNPEIELEEIKKFLQSMGVIHPGVSFTLRNEVTGCVVLNQPKSGTVSKAIYNLCNDLDRYSLHEIKVKKRDMSVSGLIYAKPHANNKLQFVYINKHLAVESRKLSKLINAMIQSKLFKSDLDGASHPVYVINIACPRFDFDCTQFKNSDVLLKCVEKLIEQVSGDSSMQVNRRSLSETDVEKICEGMKDVCRKVAQFGESGNRKRIEMKNLCGSAFRDKSKGPSSSSYSETKCGSVGSKHKSEGRFEDRKHAATKRVRHRSIGEITRFKSEEIFGGKPDNLLQSKHLNRIFEIGQTQFEGGENRKEDVLKWKKHQSAEENPRFKKKLKRHRSADVGNPRFKSGDIFGVECESNLLRSTAGDPTRGKEFIMDKFMKLLSVEAEDGNECNILHDVSFVNEKGPKRLEKLNREANLIVTNCLQDNNRKTRTPSFLEPLRPSQEASSIVTNCLQDNYQGDSLLVPLSLNRGVNPIVTNCLKEEEVRVPPYLETLQVNREADSIVTNWLQDNNREGQVPPILGPLQLSREADSIVTNCLQDEGRVFEFLEPQGLSDFIRPATPIGHSDDNYNNNNELIFEDIVRQFGGISKENELTYKSHYNNIFLPDLSQCDEEIGADVKERFYKTIIKTCLEENVGSGLFNCVLSEDEYKKFKKDLDAYMLQDTEVLNKTLSTLLFKKNNADESFRLNINFTEVYQNEATSLMQMSLFYTTRRIGNKFTSLSQNRSYKSLSEIDVRQKRSPGKIEERKPLAQLNTTEAMNDQRKSKDVSTQYPSGLIVNTETKDFIEHGQSSYKKNSLLNQKVEDLDLNIEHAIGDCLGSQLIEEWIKQEDGTHYLNTRTGMSSVLDNHPRSTFILKKRPQFLPKGLSPIIKQAKQIDTSLPPSVKSRLQRAIIKVYDNDLEMIRSSSEDLQDFLGKYYDENHRKFGGSMAMNAYNKYVSHETYAFARDLFNELRVIGQLDRKYIVTHSSSGVIFLFDQHAVGERIQLERLLRGYTTASFAEYKSAQCKEFTIEFPPEDISLVRRYRGMFENLGLQFNDFEDRLQIKKVPLCFYTKISKTTVNHNNTSNNILPGLVQNLINEEIALLRSTRGRFTKIPRCIRDVINSEACRGAIKFGDELSLGDCSKYIQQLASCQLPFHCAHGRPTVIPLVKLGDAEENLFGAAPNLKKLLTIKKII